MFELHSPGQSEGNMGGIYASQDLLVDFFLIVIYVRQMLKKDAHVEYNIPIHPIDS